MEKRRNIFLRAFDFIRSIPSLIARRFTTQDYVIKDTPSKEKIIEAKKNSSKEDLIPEKNDELDMIKNSIIEEYMKSTNEPEDISNYYLSENGLLLKVDAINHSRDKEGQTITHVDFETRCYDEMGKKILVPEGELFHKITKTEFEDMEELRPLTQRAINKKIDFIYYDLAVNRYTQNILIDKKLNVSVSDEKISYSHKVSDSHGRSYIITGNKPEQIREALVIMASKIGKDLPIEINIDQDLLAQDIRQKLNSKNVDHVEFLDFKAYKDGLITDKSGARMTQEQVSNRVKTAIVNQEDIKLEKAMTKDYIKKEEVVNYMKEIYKNKKVVNPEKIIEKQKFAILKSNESLDDKLCQLSKLAAMNNAKIEVQYDNRTDKNQPGDMGTITFDPVMKNKKIEVSIKHSNFPELKSFVEIYNIEDKNFKKCSVRELLADDFIKYGIDSAATNKKEESIIIEEENIFKQVQEDLEVAFEDGITLSSLVEAREIAFESGKDISFNINGKDVTFKYEDDKMKVNSGINGSFVDASNLNNLKKLETVLNEYDEMSEAYMKPGMDDIEVAGQEEFLEKELFEETDFTL